jgi:hypothetical protein
MIGERFLPPYHVSRIIDIDLGITTNRILNLVGDAGVEEKPGE